MIPKILTILSLSLCNAEIRNFVGKLQATPDFIHYSEGYIIAPGLIDVSGLKFSVDDGNRMLDRMTQADPAVSLL